MDRSQAPSSRAIHEVNSTLEIRPEAFADIEEAATWYEEHETGLGPDFIETVLASIDRLLVNPFVHRLRDRRRNVRWFLTNRFSYKVVYKTREHYVTVLAVLHTARHELPMSLPILNIGCTLYVHQWYAWDSVYEGEG